MKAVILTAGSAKRLRPITLCYGKVLVPIYNKPMIFYGVSLMVKCGIYDITLVVNKKDKKYYRQLFKPYQKYIRINYCVQTRPLGTAHAIKFAQKYIRGSDFVLLFGDNVFVSHKIANDIKRAISANQTITVFTKSVDDPQRFGVVKFDQSGQIISIEEKPQNPQTNNAITGLYILNNSVFDRINKVTKSVRGEYELTDIIESYITSGARAVPLEKSATWLDTGTFDSLLMCSQIVKDYEQSNGLIGCLEIELYKAGLINKEQLIKLISVYGDEYKSKVLKQAGIKI